MKAVMATCPIAPRCVVRMGSGKAQQKRLWHSIATTPYECLPMWSSPAKNPLKTATLLAKIGFDTVFQRTVVDAPYHDTCDIRPPRDKLFHTFGVCAAADFIIDCPTPYTGIFATGGPAILRLSLATDDTLFCPGLGLKVFRDNAPSANLLAAPSLDPQVSRDVFKLPFLTHVSPPETLPARFFFEILGRRFDPYAMTLTDAAACDRWGKAIEPRAPSVLTLQPRIQLPTAPHQDFRAVAARDLGPGDRLWDVHADGLPLGHIQLSSHVIASRFGDRELAFAHHGRPQAA